MSIEPNELSFSSKLLLSKVLYTFKWVFVIAIFFSISDFSLYYNRYLVLFFLAFIFCIFFLDAMSRKFLFFLPLLFYSLSCFLLLIINFFYGGEFSFLLIMPLVSYMCATILINNNCDVMGWLVNVLYIFMTAFFIFGVVELLVKLSYIRVEFMADFISEYGDKRLDVLRMRSFFGSSLSAASLCILFFIFFLYIRTSFFGFFISFLLVLLTGSRTGVAICIFLSVGCIIFRGGGGLKISISKILIIISVVIIFLIASWESLYVILIRSVSFELDSSFYGRYDTTIKTMEIIIHQLPYSLYSGLESNWISDSAIVSIAAKNGIILAVLFLTFFYVSLNLVPNLKVGEKIFIGVAVFIGIFMIGDFFIPAVTFLYFLIFFIDAYSARNSKRLL